MSGKMRKRQKRQSLSGKSLGMTLPQKDTSKRFRRQVKLNDYNEDKKEKDNGSDAGPI